MYITFLNVACKIESQNFFLYFVYSNKDNEQNKTNLFLKFMKVFNLPVGMRINKSYQFHAAHASFILVTLFLANQRVILGKCQKY